MEKNLETNKGTNNEISDSTNKPNSDEIEDTKGEKVSNNNNQNNSAPNVDIKNENDIPATSVPKPKKELPLEKKPFQEFINNHLIPA